MSVKIDPKHHGVTLIALIITIIVILILVGVSVNVIMGENSIIKKAIGATNKYKEAEEKESKIDINYFNKDGLALSEKEGTLTYPNTKTITITENTSEGLLSVKSSDESVVKASISGTAVTLEPQIINEDGKKVTITVTSAATGNYAEQTTTYTATVNRGSITINATAYTGDYDGNEHDAVSNVTTNPTGTTITYALGDGSYSANIPKVTVAGSYTVSIKASKAGYVTKEISKTVTILAPPQIGDLVNYTPDIAANYTKITAATGGYNSNQSIPQETTLKWKVLSLNEDGSIDLIADKPISTKVYFKGALGYNNGVYLLDDLCKSQYSNASLGAIGRSIDLVDIEKHFNDAGRAARDAYSYNETKYGNTKTYSSNFYTPDVYKNHDKNVTASPNNIAQMESEPYYSAPTDKTFTQESSLTIRQTYYDIASQASYYDDPNFHTLIFGTSKTYWLASRYVSCYFSSSNADFGLRVVNGTDFNWINLFNSNNNTGNSYYLVRPVVSLGSNYQLKHVSGTNVWDIVRK